MCSLHHFHYYAVRDRIDLFPYSSELPIPDIREIDFESFLPSSEDVVILHKNLAILMGRILRKNMPFFETFASGLGRHIMHDYYEDMCSQSEVVSYICNFISMKIHAYITLAQCAIKEGNQAQYTKHVNATLSAQPCLVEWRVKPVTNTYMYICMLTANQHTTKRRICTRAGTCG